MNQTPISRYQHDLQQPGFVFDKAQQAAVLRLQVLYDALVARQSSINDSSWRQSSILRYLLPQKVLAPITSIYFWGGVGRGKTYIMDTFYETLPFDNKMRTHFHRFMRRVHEELTALKGQKNPLEEVAEKLANEACIICFDEFFVADITDAMILGRLLQELFARNVVMVMTSNIEPDGLYRDGLQRDRFLPAIKLLNQHAEVINVDGGVDYRLRELKKLNLYHCPIDDSTDEQLLQYFDRLAPDKDAIKSDVDLMIEGREIPAIREADDVVLFDFYALCDGPRSQNDYIVLACEYHSVIVAGVPAFGRVNDDQARRFVYMVDEFYDRSVKLILSAEKPLSELYGDGKLKFEFERTVSRLLEMQSEEYLASAHLP